MGAARLDAMLGHLGINVPDLVAAKRYYDALMPLVGFEPFFGADDEFAYRPAGNKPGTYLFFYPAAESGEYSSQRTGLQHLAFIVRARSLVENGTTTYRKAANGPSGNDIAELTTRELDVLTLIGQGLSNGEIADELCISGVTVKSHIGRIFGKLGLRDRAAAIVYAYDNGIVAPR